MADSIAIVGGGIAGLSAGCYGQMNGYRTRIFEMHDKPGGLCTGWKRNGYTFDGCIEWLVGSKDGSSFNKVWSELGAVQGRRMIDHEEFIRVEGVGGKALILYNDADRLERHMKELSPSDGPVIEELTGTIRELGSIEIPLEPPEGLRGAFDTLKGLPSLLRMARHYLKFRNVTVQQFCGRFSDPFIREAFGQVFNLPDFSMLWPVMNLAWICKGDAGYPEGGSLEFSHTIERRYTGLGGDVSYKSPVKEILVEGARAVGVRLEDGSEHRAERVISAADGRATIFDMLGGRYVDDEISGMYDRWPTFEPLVQVSFGVARDLSDEPHALQFQLEKPIEVGGKAREWLGRRHYCFDKTLAPPGKSVVVVLLPTEYDYWETLHGDREKYEAEKKRVADQVTSALEGRFAGFRDSVEVVDVATPMTYVRYTGNWRGSYEGWLLTRETNKYMIKRMRNTLPGLDNFYMVGQWVMPGGGLPPAALSGREVIRTMCKKDGRRFTTSQP
jgi:phytoene dehydrogenase-like protein